VAELNEAYLSGDAPSLSGGHGGGLAVAATMVSSAGSLLAMLHEAAPSSPTSMSYVCILQVIFPISSLLSLACYAC